MLERKFQRKVMAFLHWHSCEVFRYDPTGLSGINGVPDLFGHFPNGKIFYIELKAKVGRTSKLQKYWINRLSKTAFAIVLKDTASWQPILLAAIVANQPEKEISHEN